MNEQLLEETQHYLDDPNCYEEQDEQAEQEELPYQGPLSPLLPSTTEEQAAMDKLIAELQAQVARGEIKPQPFELPDRMTIPEFFIPLLHRPEYRTRGVIPTSATEFVFVTNGTVVREGLAVKAYYMAQSHIYFWGTERQFIEAQLDQTLLDTYLADLDAERLMGPELYQRLGNQSKMATHDAEKLWGKRCANFFCPHTVAHDAPLLDYFEMVNAGKLLEDRSHMRLQPGQRAYLPYWMFASNSHRRTTPDNTTDLCLDCIKAMRVLQRALCQRPGADFATLIDEGLIERPVELDPTMAPLSPDLYFDRIEQAEIRGKEPKLKDLFPERPGREELPTRPLSLSSAKMHQKLFIPTIEEKGKAGRQGLSWKETIAAGQAAREKEFRCSCCGMTLPFSCFPPDPKRKDRGCAYYCRKCTSNYQRDRRLHNVREQSLKKD